MRGRKWINDVNNVKGLKKTYTQERRGDPVAYKYNMRGFVDLVYQNINE